MRVTSFSNRNRIDDVLCRVPNRLFHIFQLAKRVDLLVVTPSRYKKSPQMTVFGWNSRWTIMNPEMPS